MDLVPASAELLATWEENWATRSSYIPPDRRANFAHWAQFAIHDRDADLGVAALGVSTSQEPDNGVIADVWVAPEHRRSGHASRALPLAEQWCRDHGARALLAHCSPEDPAHVRLFGGYSVTSRHMTLEPLRPDAPATEAQHAIKPMAEEEFQPWRDAAARSFAEHDSGATTPPEQALSSARAAFDQILPEGMNTHGHEFLTLHAHGVPVASLWLYHNEGAGETFVYDVLVWDDYRGKGYGRAIMGQAAAHAVARGMNRVRLHVHEKNVPAVNLYRRLGYRTTAEFRVKRLA